MLKPIVLLIATLCLMPVVAAGDAETPAGDDGASSDAALVDLGKLIKWCHGVALRVFYCYDYETNNFCIHADGVLSCIDMGKIPLIDEDELMTLFHCIYTEYLLIPDIPPDPCLEN